MTEEPWHADHAARLIPTSGIGGAEEQERRATSALLAVMSAVKEFGRAILKPLGAPAGPVATFIEVVFDHDGKKAIPDGIVRVKRGQTTWTALVEVKTGNNRLTTEQLEAYLDVARTQAFDALITISNEIAAAPGLHPTSVDKRKTKRVALHHFSWTQVLSEAVLQKSHRGVSDPEQAWILGELIRYLEYPGSGALEFDGMGPSWVGVRDGVVAGTVRAADASTEDVASRWDQLLHYLCLRLGRRLGIEVRPVLSRKEQDDPGLRLATVVQTLVDQGILQGTVRVPNAVGPIQMTADIRARLLTCSLDVDAPALGRPATRVSWVLRQLREAPPGTRVDAFVKNGRGISTSALLSDVRDDPKLLLTEPHREIKSFRIATTVKAGLKNGAGRGSFVVGAVEALDDFYKSTVQDIKPWSPPPPRLRKDETDDEADSEVAPTLLSTSISSQDGAETTAHPEEKAPPP